MTYTIDMLLTELGQSLPLGNGERHRRPVERYTRYVLGRVGFASTANVYTEPFVVSGGHIDPLPDYILEVDDAGWERDRMSAERIGPGQHSKNELAFWLTTFGISFPNLDGDATVYLQYKALPVGEDGKPVLMEEVYTALYEYCYAKLLANFPLHPRFSQHLLLENAALGLIDQARAALNKKGEKAHNRSLRKHL